MFCFNGASLWSCTHHVQQYHCPQSQYTTSIPVTRARWACPRFFLCNCRKPFGEYIVYPKYRGGRLTIPAFQAYVWDWMMFMPDEYRILRTSRFSVPTVAYLLSRSVAQHSKLCLFAHIWVQCWNFGFLRQPNRIARWSWPMVNYLNQSSQYI